MNPKEFDWSEDQPVTVINPTGQDYQFQVHSKPYIVKAGQTVKMPGFMAWLFVYGLASQMAQDAGEFLHWNEEGFRKKFYDKLVVGTDQILAPIVTEPDHTPIPVEPQASEPEPPVAESKPSVQPMKPAVKAKPNAGSSKS